MVAELGDLVAEVEAPRLGMPRAPGYEGEGHVLVRAARTETAQAALARIVDRVWVRLGE